MFDSQDFYHPKNISSPKDIETPVESTTQVSLYSSMESSSPIRSTTSPPHYLFDEFIFAELDNSLWIISRPLGSKPILKEPEEIQVGCNRQELQAFHKKKKHDNTCSTLRYDAAVTGVTEEAVCMSVCVRRKKNLHSLPHGKERGDFRRVEGALPSIYLVPQQSLIASNRNGSPVSWADIEPLLMGRRLMILGY
ncbi:hypothetical protein Tco_0738797 [Tanacetum coccineum]